jgi:hypothetical protein
MMSIIGRLQTWLKEFEGVDFQPIEQITTDLTGQPTGYALAPTGNSKISTDILGNKTFQNSYVFWAKELAADEVDRRETHDFLETFGEWIEERNDNKVLPVLPSGYEFVEIQVSNAMLFDIAEDGTGLYQVQIQFIFIKRRV